MKLLIVANYLIVFLINGVISQEVYLQHYGWVKGIEMPGFRITKFEAFMGIPFAEPPVGNLRFESPVPVRPHFYLNATRPQPDCIQKNVLFINPVVTGQEDCLYLNIYRPIGLDEKSNLDVLVYIYGGGFFSGTASPLIHGPEYFMDTQKVILVTFSYRVGPMGFLSTGDENMSGNFGLKDQLLALKWVRDNIQEFGGSSDKVTIFGQSAGAASVQMHMLSPASKDLFRRAICLSGNAGAPWNMPVSNPLQLAQKFAEVLNISNPDKLSTKDLAKAFRNQNAEAIVNAVDHLKYWQVDPLTVFHPVIEKDTVHDAFITRPPRELIMSGEYTHIPWLTGIVPFEGAVRSLAIVSNSSAVESFNTQFDYLFEKMLLLPENMNDNNSYVDMIVNHYMNGEHKLVDENYEKFGKMITDRGFYYPLYKNLQYYMEYANNVKTSMNMYKFAYKGPYTYADYYVIKKSKQNDVVHCDDLIYLFKSPALFPEFHRDSVEADVVKMFVNMIIHFAKFGSMVPESEPSLSRPSRCTKAMLETRILNGRICDYVEIKNSNKNFSISINNKFNIDDMKFWDKILGEDTKNSI